MNSFSTASDAANESWLTSVTVLDFEPESPGDAESSDSPPQAARVVMPIAAASAVTVALLGGAH